MATSRVRGLAPWKPTPRSQALLDRVKAVFKEYRDHLPLTLRQVFYRLVAAWSYDKTEQAYSRLGEMLNRARRAGLVPFEALRDDGFTLRRPFFRESAEELVEGWLQSIDHLTFDRQRGQPTRLLIAVEAAGMLPQVERVARPYGIAVASSGGFDSVSAKHRMAELLDEWPAAEVLHIGDHDPSGVHVFANLADDVQAMLDDLGSGAQVTFTRLAVTPEQIVDLRLPTAPPKATDRRSFAGDQTVQAEAIPPDVLADLVRGAIYERIDLAAWRPVIEDEKQAKAKLHARYAF